MARLWPSGVSPSNQPHFEQDTILGFTIAADLKNGSGSIYEGEPKGEKPGCTITLSDDVFVDLALQKLDPQEVHTIIMHSKLLHSAIVTHTSQSLNSLSTSI